MNEKSIKCLEAAISKLERIAQSLAKDNDEICFLWSERVKFFRDDIKEALQKLKKEKPSGEKE